VCASNSLYIHSVESRELRRGRWRIAREPLANRQLGSSQTPYCFLTLNKQGSKLSKDGSHEIRSSTSTPSIKLSVTFVSKYKFCRQVRQDFERRISRRGVKSICGGEALVYPDATFSHVTVVIVVTFPDVVLSI
jgi:hypothetical protein